MFSGFFGTVFARAKVNELKIRENAQEEKGQELKERMKPEKFIVMAKEHAGLFLGKTNKSVDIDKKFAEEIVADVDRNLKVIVDNYQIMLNQIYNDKKTQTALGEGTIQKIYDELTKFLDPKAVPTKLAAETVQRHNRTLHAYSKLQQATQNLLLETQNWKLESPGLK